MPKRIIAKFRRRWAGYVCVAFASCTTQQATINKRLASDVPMADVQNLCIVPFSGPLGHHAGRQLRHAIDATHVFTVSDADFSRSDEFNQGDEDSQADAALSVARTLHMDAVIVGHLEPPEVTTTYSVLETDNAAGIACTLACHRIITLQGEVMILSTQRGRSVLYEPIDQTLIINTNVPIYKDAQNTPACLAPSDDGTAVCPHDTSLDDIDVAVEHFAQHFAHRLVPHVIREDVLLYADPHLPGSQQALTALAQGDWHTAVSLYQQAIKDPVFAQAPTLYRARAYYNLGTVLAFGDETALGSTYLHKAQTLAPCPLFAEQIDRAHRFAQMPRTIQSERHALHCHGDTNSPGTIECSVHRKY